MNPGRDPQCPLDTQVQGSCVPQTQAGIWPPWSWPPEGTMNVCCVIGAESGGTCGATSGAPRASPALSPGLAHEPQGGAGFAGLWWVPRDSWRMRPEPDVLEGG